MNLKVTRLENENCRCKVPTVPTYKAKFILSNIKRLYSVVNYRTFGCVV